MTQPNDPAVSCTQRSSNDDGTTPRLITDNRTPGTETIATPPWLVDSVDDCGRDLSTTWNPSECRRRRDMESAEYHVSVRHSTSIERSRRSSIDHRLKLVVCSRSSSHPLSRPNGHRSSRHLGQLSPSSPLFHRLMTLLPITLVNLQINQTQWTRIRTRTIRFWYSLI